MIRRTFYLHVVGVTHHNADGTSRQKIIREHCRVGEPIVLIPEPDNRYDPDAVRVCRADGTQLGYLESGQNSRIMGDIDSGWTYRVTLGSINHQPGTRSYGVNLRFDVLTMSRKTEERLAKQEQRLEQERAQRRAQASWWRRILGWY